MERCFTDAEYRAGRDDILLDNKISAARYRLALLENKSFGTVDPKDIEKARSEYLDLILAEKASKRVDD